MSYKRTTVMDTALGSGVADPIMNLGGVFDNLHFECQLGSPLAEDSRDFYIPAIFHVHHPLG